MLLAGCDHVFGVAPPTIDGAIVELPPFGDAIALDELNTEFGDEDPTLTEDLLEIVFMSQRAGNADLWSARRGTTNEPFGTAERLAISAMPAKDEHPHLTPDGLVLYFSSMRSGQWEIYRSERDDRDAAWRDPVTVDEIGAPGVINQMGATLPDQLQLLLTSGRDSGDANRDLFRATRDTPTGRWSTPTNLASTGATEGGPVYAANATVIYFTSEDDLYTGRIVDGLLVEQAVVRELSLGDRSETDPWVSENQAIVVFAASMSGPHDLYIARRPL